LFFRRFLLDLPERFLRPPIIGLAAEGGPEGRPEGGPEGRPEGAVGMGLGLVILGALVLGALVLAALVLGAPGFELKIDEALPILFIG
jgi:hypothetical protein